MIAPISDTRSAFAGRAAAPPQPASAPPSVMPADGVDLTHIDNPNTVAVTPIMDPAVLEALMVGAMLGGQQGGPVTVHTRLTTGTVPDGSTADARSTAQIDFALHLANPTEPMDESGLLGGEADSGKLTVDSAHGLLHFDALTLSFDQATKSVHADGRIGPVDTHLTITGAPTNGPSSNVIGFHAEGSLSGKAYLLDTTTTLNPNGSGTLHASGHLGNAPITRDYTFATTPNGALHASGGGNVAGVPTHMDIDVTMG